MKLSELKNGETAVIVKVHGHGGFRKRIVEMGFIKNKTVKALLAAPLNDPVKYNIMDYEVSLRRAEADMIEVVSEAEALEWEKTQANLVPIVATDCSRLHRAASAKGKVINIALVGNPNCGKTTFFNRASGAHEHVGNYSGVTVDAKVGELSFEDYTFRITDLPGTYSLSAYTPEELYVRKYIIDQTPDIIVNLVDASNLERNLYLTTQLIDMDVPMIMALNMYDELKASGNSLDHEQLGQLLGLPVLPAGGSGDNWVERVFHTLIDIYEGKDENLYRHIHINHGKLLESCIDALDELIRMNPEPHQNYSARFLAIKLLENDHQVENIVSQLSNADAIMEARKAQQEIIQKEIGEDSESAITDAKYGYIQGAMKECYTEVQKYDRMLTKSIDAIVTNRLLGIPLFLLMMYLMFYCTFNLGQYPMDWIDSGVEFLGELAGTLIPEGPLHDLVVNGIISGVGGVIVFLPNIMILYAFISWMEDSGYMARAAFIMDKMMHKMGLHGKSFIPMIMGFGCNIPAIMATRTIEDRKSRLITMLIIPLMSCSARLPVYIIIIGAFFQQYSAEVLFCLYLTGVCMSIIMAKLFSRYVVTGESSPFVMELPPYRMPSAKSVVRHTWEKGAQYLKKMGTTILAASIIVWALSYFPHNDSLTHEQQMELSYIGRIGKTMEPVLRPCGMEWKEGVSIITGIGAKEIVASTMGVLYSDGEEELDIEEDSIHLSQTLTHSGMTPLSAFAFLIFVLLYMPCLPACIAIKNESSRWKWAFFTIGYTTALAWIMATLVFQIGSLVIAI